MIVGYSLDVKHVSTDALPDPTEALTCLGMKCHIKRSPVQKQGLDMLRNVSCFKTINQPTMKLNY